MGLDVSLITDGPDKSQAYPEHMFTPTYLRSSYNEGGFNTAVPILAGNADYSLYWIFEPAPFLVFSVYDEETGEGGEEGWDTSSIGGLEMARNRCLEVVKSLAESDGLTATTVSAINAFRQDKPTASPVDAVNIHRKTFANRDNNAFQSFSNGEGVFFGKDEGLTVVSAIPGVDILGSPCVHLVMKDQNNNTDWYKQAAEITVEFIDLAIEVIKREGKVEVVWSG